MCVLVLISESRCSGSVKAIVYSKGRGDGNTMLVWINLLMLYLMQLIYIDGLDPFTHVVFSGVDCFSEGGKGRGAESGGMEVSILILLNFKREHVQIN